VASNTVPSLWKRAQGSLEAAPFLPRGKKVFMGRGGLDHVISEVWGGFLEEDMKKKQQLRR